MEEQELLSLLKEQQEPSGLPGRLRGDLARTFSHGFLAVSSLLELSSSSSLLLLSCRNCFLSLKIWGELTRLEGMDGRGGGDTGMDGIDEKISRLQKSTELVSKISLGAFIVVVGGGLWWSVVVCGGLWWSVVVHR